MSSGGEITAVVTAGLIAAGGLGGITTFYVAKKKTPAEVRNIAVTGSETAVLSLTRSVEVAEKQRDDAWAEVKEVRAENEQLRAVIDELRKQVDIAEQALTAFRAKVAQYEANLGQQQPPRP